MPLPSLFRGTHAEVAARCRKLLSPLKKGQTLAEVVGRVDGDPKAEGLLVVTVGPSAALKGTEAFHIYLLHSAVRMAAVEDRVFEESLGVLWGVVALNAQRSLDWLHDDVRSVPLIDATARFWEELQSAGNVFAGRFPPGKSFWDVLPTASPVLKKLGLGDDEINAVATDGLPAVLRRNGWTQGEGFKEQRIPAPNAGAPSMHPTPSALPIGAIIISARPADDYLAHFALTQADLLRGPVLDCPGGASDFAVRIRALGGRAVSVEPAYAAPPDRFAERLRADIERVRAWTTTRPDRFPPGPDGCWHRLPSWEHAAETFMADYRRDRDEATDHYVSALLPTLPFPERTFALATSGFLLFTYPDHFDPAFHLGPLRELLRVADEVRVHPLNDSARNPYPHIAPLLDALRADGVHIDLLAVESPTDRGDTHTLRLRRADPPTGQA